MNPETTLRPPVTPGGRAEGAGPGTGGAPPEAARGRKLPAGNQAAPGAPRPGPGRFAHVPCRIQSGIMARPLPGVDTGNRQRATLRRPGNRACRVLDLARTCACRPSLRPDFPARGSATSEVPEPRQRMRLPCRSAECATSRDPRRARSQNGVNRAVRAAESLPFPAFCASDRTGRFPRDRRDLAVSELDTAPDQGLESESRPVPFGNNVLPPPQPKRRHERRTVGAPLRCRGWEASLSNGIRPSLRPPRSAHRSAAHRLGILRQVPDRCDNRSYHHPASGGRPLPEAFRRDRPEPDAGGRTRCSPPDASVPPPRVLALPQRHAVPAVQPVQHVTSGATLAVRRVPAAAPAPSACRLSPARCAATCSSREHGAWSLPQLPAPAASRQRNCADAAGSPPGPMPCPASPSAPESAHAQNMRLSRKTR